MSLQTVEKWTLREIQEKMHGGSGPPSLNTKSSSVPNQTGTASGSSSSSVPPPPIPARRLASHPPAASSGKTDSHHQHQLQQGAGQGGLGVKEKDISESHSAPSSPTEKGHKDGAGGAKGDESGASGGTTVSPRHSSRSPNYQRPKSVVVDMNSSGLNYAQVQFENGRNVGGRPKAAQRRNTKYTSIAYQPENAADKAKRSSKAAAGEESNGHGHGGKSESKEHHQQKQARQPTSPPAGRNTDHHHHHHHHHHVSQHGSSSPRSSPVPPAAMDSATTYDVPPPVPMRMDLIESNEGGVVGGGDKSSGGGEAIVHKRHSSDPFHGGASDPFAQDPFGGDSGASAWDDPAAFYDKPPCRQPIPARSEPSAVTTATTSSTQAGQTPAAGRGGGISSQQQLPGGGIVDENAINSADFTGESSYEDTMEVLQNLQLMKSGVDPYAPASATFMGQDNKKTDQHSHHHLQGHNEMSSPDLNQEKDSYQFPTELAKYPLKAKPDGGQAPGQATMPIESQPRCKEEPTLHTFNYSPKLPHSSAVNVPTSSASGVTRHESFSRSSRNMPLPPLPTEMPTQQQQQQQQQPSPWQPHPVDHAPPLPARTVPNAGGKPPLPGNHPSMRKAAATSDEQPPRLPPPNHPWGNKRHPGEPTDSAGQGNPPLPPRKKDGSSGAELPGAPPPAGQQQQASSRKDDLAMRELIALGYSKAEIDRALKITRNDYSMAKMILQEFGGRH